MVTESNRRFKFFSSLIFSTIGFLAVGQMEKENTSDVEGHAVTMVGACSVSDVQVSCWDPAGRRNSQLTERIKAHLINSPQQGISLRFRKKNRLLIARSTSNFYLQCQYRGQYLNQTDRIEDGGLTYQLFWVPAEDSDASATLTSNYSVQIAKDVRVKLKAGETGDVAGHKFEILDISKAPTTEQNGGFNGVMQGPHWFIHYRMTPPLKNDLSWNVMFTLVNSDGDTGSEVDKDGKMLVQKPNINGFMNGGNSLISFANQNNYLISRADPSSADFIQINVNKNTIVSLTPVKLDPTR